MGQSKLPNDSLRARRENILNQSSLIKKQGSKNLKDPDYLYFTNLFFKGGIISYAVLSSEFIIREANLQFAEYLGYPLEKIYNSWLGDYMTSKGMQDLKHKVIISTDQLIIFLSILIRKDGKKINVHFRGKSFEDKKSGECFYCFVFTDGTNEEQSVEQLKILNLNLKIKDELISSKEKELEHLENDLQNLEKKLEEQNSSMEQLHLHIIENEMRLKLAFDAVNDGIWDWNLTSNKIYFSDRFFVMLGYDTFDYPHEIETIKKLLHQDDLNKTSKIFDDVLNGKIKEYSVEYRMRKKNDDYLWILSRGKLIGQSTLGEPIRMIGTHVDITEQKTTELQLKEKEAELKKQNEEQININRKLLESNHKNKKINEHLSDKQAHLDSIMKTVPVSVGLVSERILLFVNKYTSLMTGYEIEEIIGRDASFLYPSEEEYGRVCEILYNDNSYGNIKSINSTWRMKNGTVIDVYITATNIDIEGPTKGYTFSALDVTAQRLYEDELIKAKDFAEKAEKLKSVFLANISHELRTPMNGIIGFAELLQNQVNQTKKEQYLKIIVNSSRQLLKIITDIVDISKIETSEIEVFNTSISLNKVLKEFYNNYVEYLNTRNKMSIELTYSSCFPDNCDKIIVDEIKFKQVLTNILNNAVKFTENGNISFGCDIKANFIEFYVRDTGIGIDPEEKEYVFECFRKTLTTKNKIYGGTGLGLSIAKGFIKAMGGEIWVDSEPDKGSVFYFTIPYQPVQEQIVEEQEEVYTTVNWRNNHILVVEDDMACLALINELLEETKIKISNATTGLEAVKICRKDPTIDFVLMDMRLPEMDGYEATRRIKEFRPELPIIAQTAHALSDDKKKCLSAGCDDYLTKPIIQNILFDTISKFLEKAK
jgi:PAS domain S-box-containing protein